PPPRHPPRSPLSPYTTLFRSRHQPPLEPADIQRRLNEIQQLHGLFVDAVERVHVFRRQVAEGAIALQIVVPDDHVQRRAQLVGQDRKSTRLNSSHEWISYAVF